MKRRVVTPFWLAVEPPGAEPQPASGSTAAAPASPALNSARRLSGVAFTVPVTARRQGPDTGGWAAAAAPGKGSTKGCSQLLLCKRAEEKACRNVPRPAAVRPKG